MADEHKEHEGKGKGKGGKKAAGSKRMHLHEVRTTQAEDGSLVHHHTYKKSADDEHPMPERGPMATSSTPDEAGQHVAEQFGMNGMAQPEPAGGEEAGEGEAQGGGAPPPPEPGA